MARSHDDAREDDDNPPVVEGTTAPAPDPKAGEAILARLTKLDADLRAGSGALGQAPGDGLCTALEELIERHTMHRKV